MGVNENEDTEERVERLTRGGTIRRLRPAAEKAAWVSFLATTGGISMGASPLLIEWIGREYDQLYCSAALLLLIGQGATFIAYARVVRLKMAGMEETCWKPVLLSLPGVIVSTLIAMAMMRIALG